MFLLIKCSIWTSAVSALHFWIQYYKQYILWHQLPTWIDSVENLQRIYFNQLSVITAWPIKYGKWIATRGGVAKRIEHPSWRPETDLKVNAWYQKHQLSSDRCRNFRTKLTPRGNLDSYPASLEENAHNRHNSYTHPPWLTVHYKGLLSCLACTIIYFPGWTSFGFDGLYGCGLPRHPGGREPRYVRLRSRGGAMENPSGPGKT